MSEPVVLYETRDAAAILTINRPKALNALNADVMDGLETQLDKALSDDAIRTVIITGSGEKAFVAGADISQFPSLSETDARLFAERGQALFNRFETSPKPVIAAVNGFALGGGCELASACHMRTASKNARFGQPEVALGIMAGYGGTQRLARLIGLGRALEWLATGDQFSAEEAYRIGLVNRLGEAGDALALALDIAESIAKKAPAAVHKSLDVTLRGADLPLADALKMEAEAFGRCFTTTDAREGVTAFLEKRAPQFTGK